MTDIKALDSEQHRNLRVVAKRGAEYGEETHIVPVFADELRTLALEYPVVLLKDQISGRFGMCAILGFEPGENLFLDGEEWGAAYVPVHFRRQPFSLSYTAQKDGEPDPASLVISVDMDDGRVQEDEGEVLFNEDGSPSPYLQGVNDLLAGFDSAAAATEAFINALTEHDLIEAAQLDVQFADGEKKRFEGIYSVGDDRLGKLDGEALADLHKRGFLQGAWLMLASIGNVQKMLVRKAGRGSNTSQS